MTLAFQYLATDPNGDTEIAGHGLRVYTVLGEYEMGMSAEAIADEADIPVAAVYEALAYAAENSDEMAAIAQADDAAYVGWMNGLPGPLRQAAEEGRESALRTRQEAIRKAKEARRSTPVS
ncbi:MAG: hypothetical protein HW416_2860 [Chloroflexi bacterium]|nr:hypothetical protein [Chloroflexota bacterium]